MDTGEKRPISPHALMVGVAAVLLLLAVVGVGAYWLGQRAAPPPPIASPAQTTIKTTWTLWEVKTTDWLVETKKDPQPKNHYAIEVEKDIDRAACELVRQGEIRKARESLTQRPTVYRGYPDDDGVVYFMSKGGGLSEMTHRHFYCVKVGEKPPKF